MRLERRRSQLSERGSECQTTWQLSGTVGAYERAEKEVIAGCIASCARVHVCAFSRWVGPLARWVQVGRWVGWDRAFCLSWLVVYALMFMFWLNFVGRPRLSFPSGAMFVCFAPRLIHSTICRVGPGLLLFAPCAS